MPKKHCVKEFIFNLKDKVGEAGLKLDGVMFDYDSYDEYVASRNDTDYQMFVSIGFNDHRGDVSYMLDIEKRVISLVSSNGYNWFAIGTPKDIDLATTQDSLISLTVNLLAKS